MTPKQVFDDSFRIAELLIHVYRLLDNDGLKTEGHMIAPLREMLECEQDEQIQLIVNAIFLGCIRENANIPGAQLRPQSLQNLLRQAVVSGCTAYETYLSTLSANLNHGEQMLGQQGGQIGFVRGAPRDDRLAQQMQQIL